jgi:hypothetical protein
MTFPKINEREPFRKAASRGWAQMSRAHKANSGSRHNGEHNHANTFILLAFLSRKTPCALFLTASFGLTRVIGLVCHRRLRGVSGPSGLTSPFRKLHTSVEASGPHDFAVRVSAASSARPRRVHRIPPLYQTAKRRIFAGRAGQRNRSRACRANRAGPKTDRSFPSSLLAFR